ncbi:RecT family recombinase [Acinetobacter cumulans]|uniref:RecT family recombinase n=1 Tax=Acinetobacter cumulans TaxID=2136182 RepID=UPI001C087985|nr:RecT family recombinase [Acinetobacter cumulans]
MNAVAQTNPVLPVNSQTSNLVLDPVAMQNMVSFADFMSKATITVPKHLQGQPGDCLAVTMQAMQWDMNPFAVAQKTHIVNGNLGYEAQLINAVIISKGPIVGRPDYEWYGDWSKVDGKTCKAHDIGVRTWVTIKGDSNPRVLDVSFAQVGSVRNSPLWVNDPKQQIAYLATKKLARLHFPDVILGVYSEDELQDYAPMMDVSPSENNAEYLAFEAENLPHFQNEAQYGSERLQSAYMGLLKGEYKRIFWTTHSANLKQIAELADQALARQGETYDHSPA